MNADRVARDRRAYRLAAVLTGSPRDAERIVGEVVSLQPKTDVLDGARLDRLVVLSARERPARPLEHAAIAPAIATRLAEMPHQSREAWMLIRVFGHSLREAARAMDCSRTALERHLEAADRLMAAAVGARLDPIDTEAVSQAVAGVRAALPSVSMPGALAERRDRRAARRRWWNSARWGGVIGAVLAGGVAVAWLVRTHGTAWWEGLRP